MREEGICHAVLLSITTNQKQFHFLRWGRSGGEEKWDKICTLFPLNNVQSPSSWLNTGGNQLYVSSLLQAGMNMQPPQSTAEMIGNMQFAQSQLCMARDGHSTYYYLRDLEAAMAPNGFVPLNPSDPNPFG